MDEKISILLDEAVMLANKSNMSYKDICKFIEEKYKKECLGVDQNNQDTNKNIQENYITI